jgi:hypothetical protein
MPIKGLTEQRRLPRLGKIRLGVKKISKSNKEYPSATDYFVCPDEVQAVYGKEPKALDVIIPVEDEEIWCNQYYRQYSSSRGLVCKGDGVTCRRMIDTKTGAIAGRETLTIDWREGLECLGKDCPDYKKKSCQEVMNLQFLLPKVEGLGIWQIDTGSIHSIMNINNCAELIRASVGRVSWIPLVLSLEPVEVINPDDGKKKTVHCMMLRYGGSMAELMEASERPRREILLAAPSDNEAPDDRLLGTGTPEKTDELMGQVEDDIADLWPTETIFDSTAQVVEQKQKTEQDKPKRDPATLKNFTALLKACNEDFKLQPAQVMAELNVQRTTELTMTPAECYQQIAAVRT